jgi:Kef-type K+ transport system membrane component KefB
MSAVAYGAPELPILLTISAFLYLLNVTEVLFSSLINAGLIGSLSVGIVFGPEASNILPAYIQSTFIILGYIGLILLVFEAGLSTNITLLYHNMLLSLAVALCGVLFPIAISLLLLHFGFGYTTLQAFGAGASLCSTSLGTTLALLRPELRKTRTGAVLMSAALLDDIAGLVLAAIIQSLPTNGSSLSGNTISWRTIARPILVSFAFAFCTPISAYLLGKIMMRIPPIWKNFLHDAWSQLFCIVSVLCGFVAGARYAGTSELFGAYLAGAFLSYVFGLPPHNPASDNRDITTTSPSCLHTPHESFTRYLLPLLQHIFSPIFFASIGAALPIRSLVSADGSRRVIWRGLVYSFLMVFAKAIVGFWLLIWPDRSSGFGWCGTRKNARPKTEENSHAPSAGMSRIQSATLVGLAMVARGEIALIVAQLARPILMDGTSQETTEPFAVVIWAILVTTVSGALGVGFLFRSWDKRSL